MKTYPKPLPSHGGVAPGDWYVSRLGTLYKVYAVTNDGYVWCETAGGRLTRIWIDVILGWTKTN